MFDGDPSQRDVRRDFTHSQGQLLSQRCTIRDHYGPGIRGIQKLIWLSTKPDANDIRVIAVQDLNSATTTGGKYHYSRYGIDEADKVIKL